MYTYYDRTRPGYLKGKTISQFSESTQGRFKAEITSPLLSFDMHSLPPVSLEGEVLLEIWSIAEKTMCAGKLKSRWTAAGKVSV